MTKQTPPTAPSAASRLARLILNDKFVHLFKDREGRTYVDVYERPGQLETLELPSPAANEWLRRRQYKIGGGALSATALGEVVGLLRAKALYEASPTVQVFVRVGEVNGTIFIDRGAPDWEIVKIDAHRWDLISYRSCPVRFRRDPQMAELPRPVGGGSIELLRRFANVAEADWPLVLGFLVASLRPQGPYPLMALIGGQGDGKSTTARVLQRLIDPRKGDLNAPPRDPRDLAAIAHGCWLPAFDNLSSVSAQLSDALCRLATGGTFGGRQLYTDFDQATFTAQRPVILTSITEVVARPDLLDRALMLRMVPIGPGKRAYEGDFWKAFQAAEPQILGAIYEAISVALKNVDSTTIANPPRLADFARWTSAALPGFGIAGADFLEAYEVNRQRSQEIALDSSPIADRVLSLANMGWEGTATQLLKDFEDSLPFIVTRAPGFPRSGRAVRNALDRLRPSLEAAGVEIGFGRTNARRVITLRSVTVRHPDSHLEMEAPTLN